MNRQRLILVALLGLGVAGNTVLAQQQDVHDHTQAVEQPAAVVAPDTPQALDHTAHAATAPEEEQGAHGTSGQALDHTAHTTTAPDEEQGAHETSGQAMDHEMHEAMDHEMHEAMDHEMHQAMDHATHQETGQAMDHGMHQQTDQAMDQQPDNQAMDHAAMGEPEQAELRDPHAYSNGYGRTTGPYALSEQRQVVLADEKTFAGVWVDRFEYVRHDVNEGAELEGFAWFGNSYRRFLIQTQIETEEGDIESGEVDLLYSRAVSPFWDLRYGIHHAFGENADRDWAAIGFKGISPYWLEIDATLHVGEGGHAAFDFEAEYELLLTQRLVLQPRIDFHAFSKTDADLGRGSGLATVKTGARLRYELDRQFSPYIGVEHVQNFGETADLLPAGRDRTETHWVAGLRFWF